MMGKLFLAVFFSLLSTILSASEKEAVTLQLKWSHSFQFAGYYAAKEKGFYAKEGIDVTLREFDFSKDTDIVDEMISNHAQYGVSDGSLAYAKLEGKPVVLIAQILQHSPLIFLTHKESKIVTPYDMRDKKIMYSASGGSDAPLTVLLMQTLGNIKKLHISPFSTIEDFIEKRVDVTSAYTTNEPYQLKKEGIEYNLIDPKSYGIDFYGDNLFTSQKELKEHPKRVEKMRKATLKGWEYALKHQDEIIDLIIKKYAPEKTEDSLAFEARGIYQMVMPDLIELGSFSKEKYRQMAKIYQKSDAIEENNIEEDFFYTKHHNTLHFNKEEQAWLKNNPMIKIAVMDFWDTNTQGKNIHTELIKLLNRYGKLNIIPTKFTTWKDGFDEAHSGTFIHGVANLSWSKEREKKFLYTAPYNFIPNHLIIREEDNHTKSLEDLKNKTIYLKEKVIAHNLVKDFSNSIKIIDVPTDKEIYKRLSTTKDAVATISYSTKKEELKEYHLKIVKSTYDKYGEVALGISHKHPHLQNIINKVYKIIPPDALTALQNETYTDSKNRSVNLTKQEKLWLEQNPAVTFSGNIKRLPYIAINKQNNYEGIMVDYLNEIQKYIPITLKPHLVENQQEFKKLLTKKSIDIVPGDRENPFLLKNYKPISSNFQVPIVILMKDNHTFVNQLEDIKKLKIALLDMRGYNSKIYEKYPQIPFIKVNQPQHALEALSTGHYDALLISMPEAGYYLKTLGFSDIKIVGKTDVVLNLTLFVTKTKPMLYHIIDKARTHIPDIKNMEIVGKWQKIEFAKETDYQLLYQVIGIFLFFLAGTLYWNRKLSFEINRRTISEEEANHLSHRLKLATSVVSLGIWELNLKKNEGIYHIDETMAKIYGLNEDRSIIRASEIIDMIDPEDHKALHASTQMLIEKGGVRQLEFRITRPDGVKRDIYASQIMSKDSSGKALKITGVHWDITELKKIENSLKESKRQMQTLIDNIPLQIIVTSYSGEILMVNPKTVEDYQLKQEDIKKYTISDFYLNVKEREEVIQELQQKGKIDQKIIKFKHTNNSIRSMMVSILPISFNHKNALLSIAVDMTERIEMEKALSDAKEQAESANRSKSEFLANMSHEIRTPMNSVLGFSELLEQHISDPIQKDYLNSIRRGGHALLDIINDILDLSKIEAGKLEIVQESVNLKQLAVEIESIFSVKLIKKNLNFIVEIDPNIPQYLLLDNTRIRQILFNLISNAIKFTDQGFIKFAIKKISENREKSRVDLEILIQDSGIGIKPEDIKYIFNAFEQTKGQNQKYGGTGLGLSICKKLLSHMNGEISVESQVSKGSKFSVHLNDVAISTTITEHDLQEHQAFENIQFEHASLLIVDDIKDNRKLIHALLQSQNFSIIEAVNGKDALEKLKNIKIDMIFMDLKMPVMDGYEVVEIIKNDPNLKHIPVVAVTASVMSEEKQKIQHYKFDGYLKKPVSYSDLLSEMVRFLNYNKSDDKIIVDEEVTTHGYKALPTVIAMLEEKYLLSYREIKDSGDFSLIENFAHTLETLAKEYDIILLENYVKELILNCKSFDIEHIEFMIERFPNIIEQLKSLIKNNEKQEQETK